MKDRIDRGELRIEHCPTDDMVVDFFKKPLQGRTFKRLRAVIMGMSQEEVMSEMIHVPSIEQTRPS